MNAQQLAALIARQATPAPHEISLNDHWLGTTGLDALVKSDLRRADGTLMLSVDPATIPANPQSGGFTIPANVPPKADGFLALDNRCAQIQFVVGTTIDLV